MDPLAKMKRKFYNMYLIWDWFKLPKTNSKKKKETIQLEHGQKACNSFDQRGHTDGR